MVSVNVILGINWYKRITFHSCRRHWHSLLVAKTEVYLVEFSGINIAC